jgi:hypothetical protein
MTDYRTEAEKFVTEFLDYVDEYDIQDKLNKRTNKMERSAGVETLVKRARGIFPERQKGPSKLPEAQLVAAIEASPNVVDTREMFARKTQENGGVRQMLKEILEGNQDAIERAHEFFAAENGEKEFYVPPKV